MSLVLDCSATLAWIYPDETTDAIRQVFDVIVADRCFVPTLWKLEVANGLAIAVRRGRVTPGFRADALRILGLLSITQDGETRAYAWTTALQLADRFGLTLYDAVYLELAQRLSVPLASLDTALRDAGRALQLSLIGL